MHRMELSEWARIGPDSINVHASLNARDLRACHCRLYMPLLLRIHCYVKTTLMVYVPLKQVFHSGLSFLGNLYRFGTADEQTVQNCFKYTLPLLRCSVAYRNERVIKARTEVSVIFVVTFSMVSHPFANKSFSFSLTHLTFKIKEKTLGKSCSKHCSAGCLIMLLRSEHLKSAGIKSVCYCNEVQQLSCSIRRTKIAWDFLTD